HDDFFALGGHSLLVVQLLSQLEEEGVELSLMDLFEEPTAAGLTLRIGAAPTGSAAAREPLAAVPRGGELPLSFAQEQLWLLARVQAELAALYGAYAAGRPPGLAEPPFQMADFAAWQRRAVADAWGEADLAYWRRQLGALEPLALPADRPRGRPRGGTLAAP